MLGTHPHGMFEDTAVLTAPFGREGARHVPTLDSVFDGLADYVERHFDAVVLQSLIDA